MSIDQTIELFIVVLVLSYTAYKLNKMIKEMAK